MKKFLKITYLDIKEMSAAAFLPVAAVVLMILYGLFLNDGRNGFTILKMIRNFTTPLASWWVIMVFHSYVEDNGSEVFLSFGYSRRIIGTGRTLFFTFCYILILFPGCVVLRGFGIVSEEDFFILFMIYAASGLFFGSMGFVLIMILKNTLWTIAAIMCIMFIDLWWNIPPAGELFTILIPSETGISHRGIFIKLTGICLMSIIMILTAQKLFDGIEARK